MNSSSTDEPTGESTTSGIRNSEYIYVTMTAVTAGLSIAGGIAICVLYIAFKDLRSPGRKILFFLAISDACLAFGNLLGIMWYLYSNSSLINKSAIFCDLQSALTIYFSIVSFTWVVIMATCLFATVVLGKSHFTHKYMRLFHLLAWIPGGNDVLIYVKQGTGT